VFCTKINFLRTENGWIWKGDTSSDEVTGTILFFDYLKLYFLNLNLINAKITQPTDINYSDDELTYLPYLTYLIAKKYLRVKTLDPDLDTYMSLSIERTQKLVSNYRPAAWNFIFYFHRNGNTDTSLITGSVETLQEWVMEPIDWPEDNTKRLELIFDRDLDRDNVFDAHPLIPYDERNHQRWNTDPFEFTPQITGGNSATDTGAFIFAYWGCKWVGLGN